MLLLLLFGGRVLVWGLGLGFWGRGMRGRLKGYGGGEVGVWHWRRRGEGGETALGREFESEGGRRRRVAE